MCFVDTLTSSCKGNENGKIFELTSNIKIIANIYTHAQKCIYLFPLVFLSCVLNAFDFDIFSLSLYLLTISFA